MSELLDGCAATVHETGSINAGAFGFGPGASSIAVIAFCFDDFVRKFNRQQGHQPISEAALDGQQGRGWKW